MHAYNRVLTILGSCVSVKVKLAVS